ncbi:hypothetical protein BKA70DRAFT_1295350 [Coprinopsis sp. MPI-PUGE-AT-0042]|nr:hypothetical protein BKA70DRAFT_1295350 [Coprinopsis sp. MPI-PUGE-AT-0042]
MLHARLLCQILIHPMALATARLRRAHARAWGSQKPGEVLDSVQQASSNLFPSGVYHNPLIAQVPSSLTVFFRVV